MCSFLQVAARLRVPVKRAALHAVDKAVGNAVDNEAFNQLKVFKANHQTQVIRLNKFRVNSQCARGIESTALATKRDYYLVVAQKPFGNLLFKARFKLNSL